MRQIQESFDSYGENARARGEARRKNEILQWLAIPFLLFLSLFFFFFVQSITGGIIFLLLFFLWTALKSMPLWISHPRFDKLRENTNLAKFRWVSTKRALEEDHGIINRAGYGAKQKAFKKTAYGFESLIYPLEAGHFERWENIAPAVTEKFRPWGVKATTFKQNPDGHIVIQLRTTDVLESPRGLDWDDEH
jgi:hypothetical protein